MSKPTLPESTQVKVATGQVATEEGENIRGHKESLGEQQNLLNAISTQQQRETVSVDREPEPEVSANSLEDEKSRVMEDLAGEIGEVQKTKHGGDQTPSELANVPNSDEGERSA
jgi:hypothetical protein